MALTLDACGGPGGSGFDEALVAFLEREAVPATVFVSVPWAEANPSAMARLAANPLFEIANHGWAHRPASVVGRSAYGLQGTRDVAELVEEIELGARALERLTGRKPRHFRPGTAHSDEVAVRVANELGYEVVGFSVVADAGPGANTGVQAALLSVVPGDIVLLHVNQPRSGRAPGLMTAVPVLQERGYRFVRLSEAVLEDGQAGPAPPPPLPIPAASR